MSEYICPITQDIMTDPVTDEFGHTYDRQAINQWFQTSNKSPVSGQEYQTRNLVTNFALKSLIDNLSPVERAQITASTTEPVVSAPAAFITAKVSKYGSNYLYTISGQNVDVPRAIDVVLVVDRSGSMATRVSAKNADGSEQENGLTIMSIVKHAMQTVVKTLGPNDRVGIVIYDNQIDILEPFSEMNQTNQTRFMSSIETIQPRGGTNLYDGVRAGLELIGKRNDCSRNASVILLTDGQPNHRPSQGEVAGLTEEGTKWDIRVPINTFGFGFGLESKLLYDISRINNQGMYCFIPDGGMVGTVFINAISNLRTIAANDVTIGNTPIGPVYHNRPRRFVSEASSASPVTIGGVPIQVEELSHSRDQPGDEFYIFVDIVTESLHNCIANSYSPENPKQILDQLNVISNDFADTTEKRLLLENINDQVRMAFENEHIRRWGLHYVRSFIRSLEIQIKSNFKDPGLSMFIDPLFNRLCAAGDVVFNGLEPPKPDERVVREVQSRGGFVQASQSMRTYNISSNPCFAGETNVTINGGWARMDLLRKGDIVKTPEGDAKVVCVVKTLCYDSDGYRKAELCEFSMGTSTSTRLLVTPNHPILHNGKWVLPKEIKKPEWRSCKAVYSLVLDKYHIITVLGSIRAICLGHDYHSPEILEHDYFGSQRVIDDLKQMKGWSEGLVVLKSGCVVPDGNGSIKFVQ